MASRIAPCSPSEARSRLTQALTFLEVAELVLGEGDDRSYSQAAGALAVLSGIASADAACCTRLQTRSRGQSHSEAVTLLESIGQEGPRMARDLRRLIDMKDDAHYSTRSLAVSRATDAVSWARRLYDAAEAIL